MACDQFAAKKPGKPKRDARCTGCGETWLAHQTCAEFKNPPGRPAADPSCKTCGQKRSGHARSADLAAMTGDSGQGEWVGGETALYEPIRTVLASEWKAAQDFDSLIVEVTNGKKLNPSWGNPDLVAFSAKRVKYSGRGLETRLYTFEVKPKGKHNNAPAILGQVEQQSKYADYAIGLIHVEEPRGPDHSNLISIAHEKKVGLILFSSPTDYQTWREAAPPVHKPQSPSKRDGFIDEWFSVEGRQAIERIVQG